MRRREASPGRRGPKRRRAAALQGGASKPGSSREWLVPLIQELLTGEKALCRFEEFSRLFDERKVARF
jgi:hypothetical protein